MFVHISVNYCGDNEYTQEFWAGLAELWPSKDKPSPRHWENNTWGYSTFPQTRASYGEIDAILKHGLKHLHIEAGKGTMLQSNDGMGNSRYPDDLPQRILDGKVVQITLPDIGLMLIDEVTWLDDACTEALQAELNAGWRILAVCPPNAQRRPDYILGRTKDRMK